jgi:hypothetical protein
MRLKRKAYRIEISVKIVERSAYSDKIPDLYFSVRENSPEAVNPLTYVRQRLSEELMRHGSLPLFNRLENADEASEI